MEDSMAHQEYQKFRDELLQQSSANSAQWNRATLILSSAALAVTGFCTYPVVDVQILVARPLLIVVWSLLSAAILFSLLSYHVGQWAVAVQLSHARRCHLEEEDQPLSRTNTPAIANTLLGILASMTFIAATICFVVFMSLNLSASPAL